jgi:hypothetical protein
MKPAFAPIVAIALVGMPTGAETLIDRFEPGVNQEVLQLVFQDSGLPLLLTIERSTAATSIANGAQGSELLKLQALGGAAIYSQALPAKRTLIAAPAFPSAPGAMVLFAEGSAGLLKMLPRITGEKGGLQAEKRIAAPAHLENVYFSGNTTFLTWREGAIPHIGFLRNSSADAKIEPFNLQASNKIVAIEDAIHLAGTTQIVSLNAASDNQDIHEFELSSYTEDSLKLLSRRPLGIPSFKFGTAMFVHGRNEPSFIIASTASTLAGERQWSAINALQPNAAAFLIGTSSPEARDFAVAPACNGRVLVAQRTKSGTAQGLSISLAGPARKTSILTIEVVNPGVIASTKLLVTHDYVYVASNYSKLEQTRRADGWYSWSGYRVDRFKKSDFCSRAN